MDARFELPRTEPVHGRMRFIAEHARNRRVLHIGCVDSGLTEDRLNTGDLLHARLERVAATVAGIDIDAAGIDLLRRAGFDDLDVVDVTSPGWSTKFQEREFDVVIVSEVIEHLPDTTVLLGELLRLAHSDEATLVITVPSPFSPSVLLSLLRNEEFVHPDHLCWYSYRTIRQLVERTGFLTADIRPYTFEKTQLRRSASLVGSDPGSEVDGPRSRQGRQRGAPKDLFRTLLRRVAVRALFARSPWWSDGIIVVARWPDDRTPRSPVDS